MMDNKWSGYNGMGKINPKILGKKQHICLVISSSAPQRIKAVKDVLGHLFCRTGIVVAFVFSVMIFEGFLFLPFSSFQNRKQALAVECGSVTLMSLVFSVRVMLKILLETTA
jgi:hypothetical protein